MTFKFTASIALLAVSLGLSGCITSDGTSVSFADLQLAGGIAPPEPTPDLDETELPFVPSDKPMEKANFHFGRGEFGHAERYYREAAEMRPDAVDAWIGLAASYDQLRRFDLSARAYNRAISLVGPSATILNNMGYSYLLQGNLPQARKNLLAAYELEPENPHVQANLELLRGGVTRAQERHRS